jgi:hypothetical protein
LFLQSKASVRQAATASTLSVVRALREEMRSTGVPVTPERVMAEVSRAVKLLADSKKYPKQQELVSEDDELFQQEHWDNVSITSQDQEDEEPPKDFPQ